MSNNINKPNHVKNAFPLFGLPSIMLCRLVVFFYFVGAVYGKRKNSAKDYSIAKICILFQVIIPNACFSMNFSSIVLGVHFQYVMYPALMIGALISEHDSNARVQFYKVATEVFDHMQNLFPFFLNSYQKAESRHQKKLV